MAAINPIVAIPAPLFGRSTIPFVLWSDTSVAISDTDDPYGLLLGGETNGGKCIPVKNPGCNFMRLAFVVSGAGTVGTFPTVKAWGTNPVDNGVWNSDNPKVAFHKWSSTFSAFFDATMAADAKPRLFLPLRELIGSAFTATWSSSPDIDKDSTAGSSVQVRIWQSNVIFNVQGLDEIYLANTVAQTFSAGTGDGIIVGQFSNELRT